MGGINRYSVSNGTVQTLTGYYEVSGDEMVPSGAAYENKEIALRVELLMQLETDMSLTAKTAQAKGLATTAAANSKLVVPQTMTLNFQSGIAEDTLYLAPSTKQIGTRHRLQSQQIIQLQQ